MQQKAYIVAFVVLIAALVWYYLQQRSTRSEPGAVRGSDSPATPIGARDGPKPGPIAKPGEPPAGTERAEATQEARKIARDESAQEHIRAYGENADIRPDPDNPQVQSIIEAAKQKRSPERFSSLIKPKPFNRDEWKKSPERYLNVVEPGRIFQTAQPGKGVKQLEAKGGIAKKVRKDGKVRLAVVGEPNAPVTFTVFDKGVLNNGLTSMTVRADAAGEAWVDYRPTPGTSAEVNIMAGSPLASSQVRFIVEILEK